MTSPAFARQPASAPLAEARCPAPAGLKSLRRRALRWLAPLSLIAAWSLASPANGHSPLDDSIEEATQRIRQASNPAADLLLRGEYHRIAGRWEAARRDYDEAERHDPRLPGLAHARALWLLDQGRHREARTALDALLAREPNDPSVWESLSRASEGLGRNLEAAQHLTRAIAVSGQPAPDLFVQRARLLSAAGRPDEGLRSLDEGMARLGPVVSLQLLAADLEAALGNSAGALARLDRVAEQVGDSDLLRKRRAQVAEGRSPASTASALTSRISDYEPPITGAGLVAVDTPTLNAPDARAFATEAATATLAPPALTRGPYLQVGTPTSIAIRWRTDSLSTSRVLYGTSLGNLTSSKSDATLKKEHEIKLTGLNPDQRYYYAVGTTSLVLAGNDASHTFVTSPPHGTAKPTRLWIIGDSGTKNSNAAAVRDAYLNYSSGRPADVWMMLGDNAYDTGTDAEYQAAVFNMYPTILRNTVLWPTRGNHDVIRSGPDNDYYDIFTMPTAAEAGGIASGTEAYYSFDYANIHFICLDSEGTNRSASGAMATWLRADLAANRRDWVIAYWHHPPYTKGSHNSDNVSDSGGRMRDMREHILPILEQGGVDLVFSGHSHSYERSFLLDGHYDLSTTLTDAMKIDPGNGRENGTGAYSKPTVGPSPHQGAVYTVAGSSGKISGGTLNHPVMITSLNVLGSVILDIFGNRLDARFIDNTGAVRDNFTMIKGTSTADRTPPAAILDLGVANP